MGVARSGVGFWQSSPSYPRQHLVAMTFSQSPGEKLLWKGGDQMIGVLR